MIRRRDPGHYGEWRHFDVGDFGQGQYLVRIVVLRVFYDRVGSLETSQPWVFSQTSTTIILLYLPRQGHQAHSSYLDQIVGPLVISGVLFLTVLTNFIVRGK